ncbi:MAG: HXXEE domain-containing protein [Parcubacteria group bacterium]|nr:HXXEE domain-containing protein [Parcubacteria group bacterium]
MIQLLGVLHVVEEYFFGFSGWATRHFGTTSQQWYLVSHAALALIFGTIAFSVYRGSKMGVFSAFVVQVIIFTNGLFHIFTTLLWREYSPGVISQIVVIPVTFIVYTMIRRSGVLSQKELMRSTIIGYVISILIILSLFIDVPI